MRCVHEVRDLFHMYGGQEVGSGGGSGVLVNMDPYRWYWRHGEVNWSNRVFFGPGIWFKRVGSRSDYIW